MNGNKTGSELAVKTAFTVEEYYWKQGTLEEASLSAL